MDIGAPQALETILIVDDMPFNLTLLGDILKAKFKVVAARNGETALKIARAENPPDLILLDIVMPGINGYDVCAALKVDEKTAEIPILFASSLIETPDIVRGFEAGGVDYITKPFQPEEVLARVEVHLALKRAKAEVQSLLSKTLVGSVRLLVEMLAMLQPLLLQQSNRIRRYVKAMLPKLSLTSQDSWSIELAAMLSHIGCISMPERILHKKFIGKELDPDEEEMYSQYPALGAKLLENIPRLEKTATMVRNQLANPLELNLASTQVEYMGSMLLNLLVRFDHLVNTGSTEAFAYYAIRNKIQGCPEVLMKVLNEVIEGNIMFPEKHIPLECLETGMILAEHMKLCDGRILLSKGTEMTPNLIDRVRRFVKQDVCVMESILVTDK